ncbi:MAG: hypothetical protein Ct9H90mP20_7070 [Candidatus Neomarinimicrobiota bacterium]|nr:MAG: hypothetical protein Ct9H90mP20_7070 [Candidatus Neomarinimicrobiota bacterium]
MVLFYLQITNILLLKLIKLFTINLLVTYVFGQELISLSSANPFGFKDVITNLDQQDEQEVDAILKLPTGQGPFPF